MKKWMKRCLAGLLLLGLAVSVPAFSGCDSKAANKDRPGFNPEALDPSTVKIPLTDPGGAPAGMEDTTTE